MTIDAAIREAERATEFEVLAEALGVETSDLPNAPSESFVDEAYHTDVEGWDGEPLDQREIAARNLYGDPDGNGQDRPLQYEEDLNYLEQLQQANEHIAQLQAHNAELAQRADPQLQARLAAQREEQLVQMIADPERAAQQIYQEGLAAGRQASNINRNNASMAAAHRQYGADFERAYDALQRLDPNNPVAREFVRGVMADEDPGQAILQWHESYGSRGPQAPFMGGNRKTPSAFRSLNSSGGGGGNQGSPFRQDYEARTDSSEEDDIMGYALGR
jgi:hypothetical protein